MKTAILGGSFNPVHRGHLNLAGSVLENTHYRQVIFVPAGIPPHKELSWGASDAQRLEMLRIALDGRSGMSIWDGEMKRPGKSYTIDTVFELRESGIISGKPGLVIGDDLLDGFHTWRNAGLLIREVEIILACRETGGIDGRYSGEWPFSPLLLNNDVWPYSSTEVRKLIADGSDTSDILLPDVARYIRENNLYGHTG